MIDRGNAQSSEPAGNAWPAIACGALVGVAAALVYRAALGGNGLTTDDSHIHLRIAHNWANGLGPVFNPGERVEASSSPAWLALLTLGLWAGAPTLALLTTLEVLASGLTGAATAWLAQRCGGGKAATYLAPALVVSLPSFGVWAGTGMETTLACAMLALATAAAMSARTLRGAIGVGLLGALLVLVRQESLVAVPVLAWVASAGISRLERWKTVAVVGAACGVPLVALLLLRHSYFGAWVPNTYVAKVAGETLSDRAHGIVYVAKFVVIHVVLFALAIVALIRKRSVLVPAALVVAAYLAAVTWTGGDHFYYQRLALPTLPLVAALAAVGVESVRGIGRTVALVVLAAGVPFGIFGAKGQFGYAKVAEEQVRYSEAIGASLSALPPGTVATISIGGIGDSSGRPILDLVGLTDTTIARSPRIPGAKSGHNHGDKEYVLRRAPEFVIPMVWLDQTATSDDEEKEKLASHHESVAAAEQLVLDPRFRERYVALDWHIAGGHVRIWERADVAAANPKPPAARD